MKPLWKIGLCLTLCLTSCSGVAGTEQPQADGPGSFSLRAGASIGQTFVANQSGLSGAEIFLGPEQPGAGYIHLSLLASPADEAPLAQARLPVSEITRPDFYRFTFPSQMDSGQKSYYLKMDLSGEGSVRVGHAAGDAYLDGALYQADQPVEAQLAFRLIYEPVQMGLGLLSQALSSLGLAGLVVFLYVLPGLACLSLVEPVSQALSWPEKVSLAPGVSLALYFVLFLWTDLFAWRPGAAYAWGPGLIGLAVLLWRARTWKFFQWRPAARAWVASANLWPDITLGILVMLLFVTRLLAIRLLVAPSWGDSVQHAVITQLMLDHGGLFDSWQPYAPYQTLTVHYGFSAASALLGWIGGLDSTRATLLTGQILNVLSVLTLYPLTTRLAGGSRWVGVGAVLVSGLLSPMPAYYVNWGRYAQLTGQVILPVGLWLLLEAVQSETGLGRKAGLAGAVLAGMMLAYYRMPFYYAVFVLAWLVLYAPVNWRLDARRWFGGGLRLALIAGVGIALFAPWARNLFNSSLAEAVEAGISRTTPLQQVIAEYQIWRDWAFYVPITIVVLASLGWLGGWIRKQWGIVAVGIWALGLSSLVAGRLIRLPGANLMQNFAVLIALYIPTGILSGWTIGQIANWLERPARAWSAALVSLGLLAAAGWGAIGQLGVVQPEFVMVTSPDVRAMAWVRDHTPRQARFLVEGFRIYAGRSIVGADAGWWLPLLAGRENTIPPQYAILNERSEQADYSRWMVELMAHLETASPKSAEGLRLLCDAGITHIYIGQGQGLVSREKLQLFEPEDFADSPFFQLLYRQDRVYVFALAPQACVASQ